MTWRRPGAFRDENFGPVVSAGSGGVLTELLDDVAFGLAPLSPAAVRALVGRLRLAGYLERHGQADRLDSLAEFLTRFAGLAAALPWPGYVLELNPVFAGPDRAVAVDGLAVGETGPASSPPASEPEKGA